MTSLRSDSQIKPSLQQRRGKARGVFLIVFSLMGPLPSNASDWMASPITEPLPTSNRNPFIAIHALPSPRSAYLTPEGAYRLGLSAEVANTSVSERENGARPTIIDGETHRLEMDVRRGLGSGWEVGLTLPFLRHSGGFMDRPIERWHDLFQLPNGNRNRLPRDRLLFSQGSPDGQGFRLDNSGGGIGDLQLSVGRQLGKGLMLRSVLKLPTGDSDRLTGSGAAAVATALHVGSRQNATLTWHASGGVMFGGDGDVLPQHRENLLAFGSATISWQITDSLSLKGQLDGHTAAYSDLGKPLDDHSLQLSLAVAAAVSTNWVIEAGFSEDIAVETAPDIVFHAGLIRRF